MGVMCMGFSVELLKALQQSEVGGCGSNLLDGSWCELCMRSAQLTGTRTRSCLLLCWHRHMRLDTPLLAGLA
jgi:hypothetical protein